MARTEKRESVFELVKAMNKAEKRNFKLYATRLDVNETSKFIALFDCLDQMEEYSETKVLGKCPSISKIQLPNLKAHLYKQILKSLRMLNVQHSVQMQIKEQIDFARILFDKGLYDQSGKVLAKATREAEELEQHAVLLDIINLHTAVEVINISDVMSQTAEIANRKSEQICNQIVTINSLSKLAIQCCTLHQQLGYARNEKDINLLDTYFKPRFEACEKMQLSFSERFYYYQAKAWYHYIRHNFGLSYRYACHWIGLFDEKPRMKEIMYDSYLRGYAQLLDGMFLMHRYELFMKTLGDFEKETRTVGDINDNARMISQQILFTAQLNKCLLEGTYKDGLWLTKSIDNYMKRYAGHLILHERMMLNYKIACLYFGDGNYTKCMQYLASIIAVKDPQIRRDLQCYARMLNLIASYEAGIDYNLDYQIRSVYSFIVKMRDMTDMKHEVLAFFKKIGTQSVFDSKIELKALYERLKPYENHPYEKRTFYYIDLLTWLESRLTGRSVGEIVREKFEINRAAELKRKRK